MRARRLVLAAAAVGVMLWMPGAASACSSDHPSFAEAVMGADAIARVVVTDVPRYGEDRTTRTETYRVERVLVGTLPETVLLDEPFSTLCGDTVGAVAPEGTEAIVAFGVEYFGNVIHPAWVAVDRPYNPVVSGSAAAPDEAKSLDDLERLIVAMVPNTAAPIERGRSPVSLAGAALLLSAATVALRRIVGSLR